MINLKEIKILFVDDDKYWMRPTIDALEVHGATVTLLTDGTAVLRYLRKMVQSPPDVLILDIMMPSGSEITTDDEGRSTGLEVYKKIRQDMKMNIPIVISTVVSDSTMLSDFNFSKDKKLINIQKPYTYRDLNSAIAKVLEK